MRAYVQLIITPRTNLSGINLRFIFQVKLANPEAKVVSRFKNLKKLREEGTQFGVFSTIGKLGFDPRKFDYANRETCEDKVLRQDIKNALTKVTNHSALAIARTLLYQIGRPGWVYNVVEQTDGYAADEILYVSFYNPKKPP